MLDITSFKFIELQEVESKSDKVFYFKFETKYSHFVKAFRNVVNDT